MGYYDDAVEWEGTAIDMENCGRYRASVYMSCLAVECYLKSKVELVDLKNTKLNEHDTIYLYRVLRSKYPTGKDIICDKRLCRKYHSDVRYSNTVNSEVYDENFANRFIHIVESVREYIENECTATLEDLKMKYNKLI